MRPRLVWSELDEGLDTGYWPGWLPYGSFAVAMAAAGLAFAQRTLVPGFAPAAIAIGIAFAPFVLDAIGYLIKRNVGLPLWLFPFPVLAGITYLVFHPVNGGDVSPFILVFMAAEVVARSDERPRLAGAVVVASSAVVIAPDVAGVTQGFSVWVMAILFASGGGMLVRMLTQRTLELRRAQEHLAENAASEERSRIAREVHDVIAHSMSVMMLHITAARMALEQRKPDDALDALREAEQQGRNSMNDIRRTVGLLGPDGSTSVAPLPSVGDLPKLISDFRTAGLDVDFRMDGDFTSVAPATGLSLFRIVQESLTNVAKHAPGATTEVHLTLGDDIRLVVMNGRGNGNGASSDGTGLGLRGMVERAVLIDGELVAGPHEDGWAVALTAPR